MGCIPPKAKATAHVPEEPDENGNLQRTAGGKKNRRDSIAVNKAYLQKKQAAQRSDAKAGSGTSVQVYD